MWHGSIPQPTKKQPPKKPLLLPFRKLRAVLLLAISFFDLFFLALRCFPRPSSHTGQGQSTWSCKAFFSTEKMTENSVRNVSWEFVSQATGIAMLWTGALPDRVSRVIVARQVSASRIWQRTFTESLSFDYCVFVLWQFRVIIQCASLRIFIVFIQPRKRF